MNQIVTQSDHSPPPPLRRSARQTPPPSSQPPGTFSRHCTADSALSAMSVPEILDRSSPACTSSSSGITSASTLLFLNIFAISAFVDPSHGFDPGTLQMALGCITCAFATALSASPARVSSTVSCDHLLTGFLSALSRIPGNPLCIPSAVAKPGWQFGVVFLNADPAIVVHDTSSASPSPPGGPPAPLRSAALSPPGPTSCEDLLKSLQLDRGQWTALILYSINPAVASLRELVFDIMGLPAAFRSVNTSVLIRIRDDCSAALAQQAAATYRHLGSLAPYMSVDTTSLIWRFVDMARGAPPSISNCEFRDAFSLLYEWDTVAWAALAARLPAGCTPRGLLSTVFAALTASPAPSPIDFFHQSFLRGISPSPAAWGVHVMILGTLLGSDAPLVAGATAYLAAAALEGPLLLYGPVFQATLQLHFSDACHRCSASFRSFPGALVR